MGALSTTYDRLSSLVANTIAYTRIEDEFDFTFQPVSNLDKVFRLSVNRASTLGLLGPAHIEVYQVDLWTARRIGRDQRARRHQLTDDLESVEAAIFDSDEWDVQDEQPILEAQLPPEEGDFLVGHLGMTIEVIRLVGSACAD